MSETKSLFWRIRYECDGGFYTFRDIVKKSGFELPESEVREWAEHQVRITPELVRVDEIYVPDEPISKLDAS